MDEFNIRIIIVLLFILFSSTLIALVRKLRHKIFKPKAPVYEVTIEFEDQNPVILTNRVITLPEILIAGAKRAYDQIQTVPEIKSKHLDLFEDQFLSGQENKKFARAAIKTFRAWHSGLMLNILDPDGQFSGKAKKPFLPKITHTEFQQFVLYTFLGFQNSPLMPKTMENLQKQYTVFFDNYDLDENEFLLGWAQQTILTNRNLIVFTADETPKIKTCVPLLKVKKITQSQTGMERLR